MARAFTTVKARAIHFETLRDLSSARETGERGEGSDSEGARNRGRPACMSHRRMSHGYHVSVQISQASDAPPAAVAGTEAAA